MSLHADGFAVSRGTALVASDSKLFTDIVGPMVADCGLTVALPVTSEPAFLSVMRTQPSLVICDCEAPETTVDALIAEASARHIPLLMARSQSQHDHYAVGVPLPNRVASVTFPVTREAFRVIIEDLLPPSVDSVHRVRVSGTARTAETAVRIRTLSLLS